MKNYIYKYSVILFSVLFLTTSCMDDVTDLQPLDAISETVAFESAETIELSMAGVYDAAQSGFYGTEGNNRGYIFGAAFIQQNDMRGEDMLLINTFYGLTYQATYSPTTPNNGEYWGNGFRLINLCNIFIEGIRTAGENGIITEEEALVYEGEARLLRAMAYHEMVLMFARPYRDGNGNSPGLPLRDVGITGIDALNEQIEVGRSSVAETYEFILADYDFAEENLPVTRTQYNTTRAVKAAAVGLKTRVYLHMGDWPNVIAEGNKLVSGNAAPFSSPADIGAYSMTPSVSGPWADNESSDNIFSMAMSENDNLNVNAALANMYGSSANGARGEVAISPIIWNETFWHPNDLRRTLLATGGASGRLFTTKYRDYTNNTDTPPIIRYAEVVLNLAEAEARAGDQIRSLALLNAVRDRALAGPMTSYAGLTGNALTQAILNERRIEFLAEGQRWKDIHRNAVDPDFGPDGIPAKMLSADVDGSTYAIGDTDLQKSVPAYPYSDFRFIWPLPNDELAANPTIADQQNPGY